MEESRDYLIERFAGWGKLDELKKLLEPTHTQEEIDIALGNAIAYSQIETAKYLVSLGADISHWNYDGVYYAVHNNELEGLKFSISMGVDINVLEGMILNTGIITAINTKETALVEWILENGADPSLLTVESLVIVQRYGTTELNEIIKDATKDL